MCLFFSNKYMGSSFVLTMECILAPSSTHMPTLVFITCNFDIAHRPHKLLNFEARTWHSCIYICKKKRLGNIDM